MVPLKIILPSILLLFIVGLAFTSRIAPVENHAVQSTPTRIERGAYLANHVSGCVDCHSKRQWQYFGHPHAPGTEGAGGEFFDFTVGQIYSPNITPAALGSWTDGEIYRAITSGVSKDGRLLSSQMPFPEYRKVATEDIYSLIAYLKSLAPIDNKVPVSQLKIPFKFYHRLTYLPADPQPIPPSSDEVSYGEYLTNLAGCQYCHTPKKWMMPMAGMEFAGGSEHLVPGGKVYSANITPHLGTGIGAWSKEAFIQRFKIYAYPQMNEVPTPEGLNTVMPWLSYAGMSEEDLGAIYEYLIRQKPIEHAVNRFLPDASTK